jgi:hypothetical protein
MVKRLKLPAIAALILTALILLCAGLFLFSGFRAGNTAGKPTASSNVPLASDVVNPIKYAHISELIDNKKQEINILEVDPSAGGVLIRPVLSHELVYG